MKTHRTDGVSLTFGLIFLFIAGWWLVARGVQLDSPQIGWFLAGGLILLGLLGLVGALRSSRTTESATDQPAAPTSVPTGDLTATGSPAWSPGSAEYPGPADKSDKASESGEASESDKASESGEDEPTDRIEPVAHPVADPVADLVADDEPRTGPGSRTEP
jgi:hypothetical protein